MKKAEGNPGSLVEMDEWKKRKERKENEKYLENASLYQILELIDNGLVNYEDVKEYASGITEKELELIRKFEIYRKTYHSRPAREAKAREITIDIDQTK